VALDRQSIEKKDFPIARRGYDPEQVDAHLARIAGEVEGLQGGGTGEERPRAASMAIAASDQVRSIIEAAEKSAAEIEQSAREDAAGIRADANRDAQQARQQALEKSAGHVAAVQEATASMLQRVAAMQQEMGALIGGLNDGAKSLGADLAELHANVDQLYDGAGIANEPAPAAPAAPAPPAAAPAPPTAVESEPIFEEEDEPETELEYEDEPVAAPAPVASAPEPSDDRDEDVEGARLIALNMALNGSSREDTEAYLVANFDISDRAGLLDEVYATVEG
jgi:DivIVA domain-containing protein